MSSVKLMFIQNKFDDAKAPFKTHLNYAKRMDSTLSGLTMKTGLPSAIANEDCKRFDKLYRATSSSIEKDLELARNDHGFAAVAAPWFAAKCYYALYYLESKLLYLLSNSDGGFKKQGHANVRKGLKTLVDSGKLHYSHPELMRIHPLSEIEEFRPIQQGKNTHPEFWRHEQCPDSIFKKMMEYQIKTHGKKWDLRNPDNEGPRKEFYEKNRLMLLDFFYWYRIKVHYRDIDYIDFERGVTDDEVYGYIETLYRAFDSYRRELLRITTK